MDVGSVNSGLSASGSAVPMPQPMALRLHRAYGGVTETGKAPGPSGGGGVGGRVNQQPTSVGGISGDRNKSPGLIGLRSLVAGVVPGRVDFSGDAPAPVSASKPFYRHPADRNAVAVQIDVGRRIDITG